MDICLRFTADKIEEPAILPGPQVDSLLCCAKCVLRIRVKKIPKRVVSQMLHRPLHVGVERFK